MVWRMLKAAALLGGGYVAFMCGIFEISRAYDEI